MIHQTEYEEIIVCLYDGHFDLGIAAFANSLVKFNYKGLVNVGYRGGAHPEWVKQLKQVDSNSYLIGEHILLKFTEVKTNMHLGYYKPFFIKETFEAYPATNKIFYFDADIVVNSPWNIFSRWLEKGSCVCLDNAFHYIHYNHPWRKDWRMLSNLDDRYFSNTNHYFNSGFLGIERGSMELLNRWIYFTHEYINQGGNINSFVKDAHSSFKGDQDLLNAAITTSADIEVNVMGKEAMGFTLPATMMMHAIGDAKPWNKGFLKQLIRFGHKPNTADKAYFFYCKYPIRIFSDFDFRMKKLDLVLASFCGRFLG